MAERLPIVITDAGDFAELPSGDKLEVNFGTTLIPSIVPTSDNTTGITLADNLVGFILDGSSVFSAISIAGSSFATFTATNQIFAATNICQLTASSGVIVALGPVSVDLQHAGSSQIIHRADTGECTTRLVAANNANIDFVTPTGGSSQSYTLPSAEGSGGEALVTDASGVLAWDEVSGSAFPTTRLFAGRRFFHTGYKREYIYDGTDWLGPPRQLFWGRNAATNVTGAQTLRTAGNVIPAANGGYPIPDDCKIIRVEIYSDNSADPMSGTFEIFAASGTAIYTRTLTTENSVLEDELDIDVAGTSTAGLDVNFNLTGGTLNDLHVVVWVCERKS